MLSVITIIIKPNERRFKAGRRAGSLAVNENRSTQKIKTRSKNG
jgi:hypothetical protein